MTYNIYVQDPESTQLFTQIGVIDVYSDDPEQEAIRALAWAKTMFPQYGSLLAVDCA